MCDINELFAFKMWAFSRSSMCHVTHVNETCHIYANESCHTCECVVWHTRTLCLRPWCEGRDMSCEGVMSHMWRSHVTCERIMWHTPTLCLRRWFAGWIAAVCVMSHMCMSRVTYIRMSHVTWINASCDIHEHFVCADDLQCWSQQLVSDTHVTSVWHTCAWVMSHIWMRHVTCGWVMWHVWILCLHRWHAALCAAVLCHVRKPVCVYERERATEIKCVCVCV